MLELRNIVGGYGDTIVLREVSVTVPDGSVVALLGPNGAGKSTLLKMASGLLQPASGRVVLDGVDVTKVSASRRANLGVCHILEGRGIFPSLSVADNLRMQSLPSVNRDVVLDAVQDAFPPLSARLGQIAGTLSGGEQQMLALVRAYIASPRVVLVDEVSLGLAPFIVDRIFTFLKEVSDNGTSLLIVEQYFQRALALASSVYLLSQGQIVHTGPASELDETTIFSLYLGAKLTSE